MKVMSLFRSKPAPRAETRTSTGAAISSAHLRREMVSMALRDTVNRHGIPKDWLHVDPLMVRGPRGDYHCYVRIHLRHWEPRLLAHASAFEASLVKRISLLDAGCSSWLRGVSWQLEASSGELPATMPPPSSWQDAPPASGVRSPAGHPPAAASATAAAPQPTGRDHLGLLLSAGDGRYGRGTADEDDPADFQPTQPFLSNDASPGR